MYTGKLLTGHIFDSSVGRAPFSFTIGQHRVIKGCTFGDIEHPPFHSLIVLLVYLGEEVRFERQYVVGVFRGGEIFSCAVVVFRGCRQCVLVRFES
jgi:hypothetical protein